MVAWTEDEAVARKVAKKERDRVRYESLQRTEAVRALYASKDGRAYLWWILKLSGALGQNPYRPNPHDTAFLCGQQNVGQQLMAHMIETDPAAFAELMKEQTNERTLSRNNPDDSTGSVEPGSVELDPPFAAEPVPEYD